MIRIYDSLSGKKLIVKKPKTRSLKLFVCGPTVYDLPHLGHSRTYLVFDIFVRYLRFQGWKVFYLQNITDVDDKIIQKAQKEKKQPLALAHFFEKKYLRDIKNLNIVSVSRYARASNFIPKIIKQVKILIKKGYAYKIENEGYYFDISKFPDYGKLSKRTREQAEDAVSRIDESIKKKNKGDFCLWKFPKPKIPAKIAGSKNFVVYQGEPLWRTEIGWGRPGWHIEDTAITETFFGPQYDLQGGGVELQFPHHEAEIAQQEAASGKKPFVKIWMHTGLLFINNQKMSKSLKNFVTIQDFLKKSIFKNPANVLRMIVLSHLYRKPINYTPSLAKDANVSLNVIEEFLEKLKMVIKNKNRQIPKGLKTTGIDKLIKKTENKFHQALEDDFNTAQALAVIFDFISSCQKIIWDLNSASAQKILKFTEKTLKIFGLTIKPLKIPNKIIKLVKKRELFRGNKQFIQADALRKKIKQLGYELEDTPSGTFIKLTQNG